MQRTARDSSPGVRVRPARPADAPAVAEIWRTGWADGHAGHVPDELVAARTDESFTLRAAARVGDTTVAEAPDGAIAGFVMVVGDEVEQVYVSRLHRGSDIAAVLLHEAERQVQATGSVVAWLAVVAGNARARRFYERQGWVDTGVFDYGSAGAESEIAVPAHRYEKRLDA
ncbi:MAG: GNAT family N-acetyltransferase [Actinobacteria bacterium]|nr:GNAT family N-acetyltransferase [Actinomycetota bacterium]